MGRGELRARLAALADETRLRIVDLLVQQDEMHAQDIIAALDLSQSSVSRHLKQLVSMKYLYERRGEGPIKPIVSARSTSISQLAPLSSLSQEKISGPHRRQRLTTKRCHRSCAASWITVAG
ncbi:MAG: metalloregulator ArsR/SmtB family transcription factor [Ktedonobacteraceae bacterium]|nr:metalloregulator ArsR/SmtB family transcription factor [Ktedonobacteraceae bacterium]